jgi:hypothetical protein
MMNPREDWDDEIVGDALDVLQDLVLWQLVPERWAQVGGILDRIISALATRDVEELHDAVADLELNGPVRALRIGSTGETGIPEPILERRNTLVHALTDERKAPIPMEADRGDQSAR